MTNSNDNPTDTTPVTEDVADISSDEDKSSTDLMTKPWDPKDIRITTKTFTLREIYTQIVEGDLDLSPDFQRSFVWKDKQQVRLIESILLGIPLPAFYFNQDISGANQVIDGVQRLTTLKHFMSDELSLNGDALEYLSKLGGTSFKTLDAATRRRFTGTQIVAHVIEPQTPAEVKYDIFNRVNTGGSPLSAQEIRHCMSKTRSRNFLTTLVESKSFDAVMGRTFWSKDPSGKWIRNNQRMMDREMALRFCAFYTLPIEEYTKATSLDTFLLNFTQSIDHQSENSSSAIDTINMAKVFDKAMHNSNEIMGRGAFRLWTPGEPKRRGPINRAIFESQAIALANYSLEELLPHKNNIQDAFRKLFLDPEYDTAVRVGTGSYFNVKRRLSIPKIAIEKILS